jgi:hypothetical protein
MLKTLNEASDDARDLIRRWNAWRKNDLQKLSDNRRGESPSRALVQMMIEKADEFAKEARRLINAGGLSDDEAHDLVVIAEELEIAVADGLDATHPDTLWASSDRETKHRLTQRMPIAKDVADRLLSRIALQFRDSEKNNPK